MQLQWGAIAIDLITRTARDSQRSARLTPREFSLLAHLVHHAHRPVGRGELLEQVWQLRHDPGTNVVEVQVARLRPKLAPLGAAIVAVRGQGYRVVAVEARC